MTPALNALERTFGTSGYLSACSDVAALMVFEHQMQMANLLTRLGWETRVAEHEGRLDPAGAAIKDVVQQARVDFSALKVVLSPAWLVIEADKSLLP